MSLIYTPRSIPLRMPYSPYRNFNHIKPIKIVNSGDKLHDYQVAIELFRSNFPFERCRADGADIRLVNENDEILPHWIESWSNTSKTGKIWCKIPDIHANSEQSIWLIYGNPSASSESSGDAVFEFFDDFEGTSLDTVKWNEVGTPVLEVSDSICHFYPDTDSHEGIWATSSFGFGYQIRAKSKGDNVNGQSWCGLADGGTAIPNSARILLGGGGTAYHTMKDDTSTYLYFITLDTDWHIFTIARVSSSKLIFDYDDGEDTYTETDTNYIPITDLAPHFTNWNSNVDTWIDWVCIRKYASPEPKVIVL